MRALCGSIIAAGALVGLGLTALGFGIRYQGVVTDLPKPDHLLLGVTPMTLALVVLLICVGVGVGIAFIGLAFHHERRHRERLHLESTNLSTRQPV